VNAESATTPVPEAAIPAAPSEGTESKPSSDVERVEVIGSRIKRTVSEGPSAIKNVGKEALKSSGNVNVSDSLRETNVAQFGVSREASGSNAAATTNIGLRGLGATRTLILLNGHRLPKDPSTEAVDLNLIPPSAIERIEVLKDGAAALYGSDALGGVINFVTKKGYVGNEVMYQVSAPERKGGAAQSLSVMSGWANEKSDLLMVLNFSRTEKIFGKDREITKGGLSSIGSPGSYRDAGGNWNLDPNTVCPPELVRSVVGGKKCFFKYNEIATTRPVIGTVNLLTDYTYRISPNLQFYNRNLAVSKTIEWNYAPAPGVFAVASGTTSVPTARTVSYRFMEAGNRDNKDTERNFSTLLGLKGFVAGTWEWDISSGYSRVAREAYGVNGYLDSTIVQELINGTGGNFDPFAAPGSRGSISRAMSQVFQKSESSILTTDLLFTGEMGEIGGEAIGSAVGVSFWNEKLDQKTDDKSLSGVIIGSAGSNDKGSRDVLSTFAEASLPVNQELEVQLAARADRYSDFGSTLNPKIAAKYKINERVLTRASVGTGFKAPTLSQLYGASSDGYLQFIDRRACAANSAACSSDQYQIIGGGNKNLKEEKAITAGIGIVAEATSQLSVTTDLWYTKITNVVGIDFEEMTQAELNGVNPSTYGVTVQRDSNGILEKITAPNLNLQEEEIEGVDVEMEYSVEQRVLGHSLSFKDDFSYMVFYRREGFPGAGKRDVIGEWGYPGWRNSITANMKNDQSSYSLTLRTIPGQNVLDRQLKKKISDLHEVDFSYSYKLTKDSQLTAGVKNLLDTAAPADPDGGTGGAAQVNGDLYDINGRRGFVGYTQKF